MAEGYKVTLLGEANPHYSNAGRRICEKCGTEFQRYNKSARYCSYKCYWESMMPRSWRACKIDANQPIIVEALRAFGCAVLDLSTCGWGCPDLAVSKDGFTLLMEIKNRETNGKLSPMQKKWHAEWKGKIVVVYTPEEAIEAMAAEMRRRGENG
jgi:hypothetical protein